MRTLPPYMVTSISWSIEYSHNSVITQLSTSIQLLCSETRDLSFRCTGQQLCHWLFIFVQRCHVNWESSKIKMPAWAIIFLDLLTGQSILWGDLPAECMGFRQHQLLLCTKITSLTKPLRMFLMQQQSMCLFLWHEGGKAFYNSGEGEGQTHIIVEMYFGLESLLWFILGTQLTELL